VKKLLAILALCCAALPCFAQQNVNDNGSVLPSASYTATTVNSTTLINSYSAGGHIIINVSAWNAGSYTPHIQGYDQVSGQFYDILVGNAISSTGVTVLKVYPGVGIVANGAAADIIPQYWRVQLIGSTPNMTLSIGYMFND
jgi:hypothetical protein